MSTLKKKNNDSQAKTYNNRSNNRRRRLCKTFGCNLSGRQNNRFNSYSTSPSASTHARLRALRRAQARHKPCFKETHLQKTISSRSGEPGISTNACSDCAQLQVETRGWDFCGAPHALSACVKAMLWDSHIHCCVTAVYA